jgi:hypothetical protein
MIINKIFGIKSLVLAALAFATGLFAVAAKSFKAGVIYFLILSAAPLTMVYFFCTKCPCAEKGCGHVFPGLLASKIGLKQGSYSPTDLGAISAAIGALVIFPQPWLIKKPRLMASFWMLLACAFLQIRIFVCRYCGNENCPGHINDMKANV